MHENIKNSNLTIIEHSAITKGGLISFSMAVDEVPLNEQEVPLYTVFLVENLLKLWTPQNTDV